MMLMMMMDGGDDDDDESGDYYLFSYQGSFDFIASFSSIEHSGLGRFGDPLDPYGDLKEMQKMRCLLKDDGLFYLGLPVHTPDSLEWNAHRVYGPLRLPLLLAGFEVVSVFCGSIQNEPMASHMEKHTGKCFQPAMVLKKAID